MLFIRAILLFMGVVIEYTIIVCVDNVGSVFLSGNTSASQQTKHIDVCHHFIRDYVEDRTVRIFFVRNKTWQIHLKRT